MANIKSAKKRILQSNKKRIRNKAVQSESKTEIKKLLHLLERSKDVQEQKEQLKQVESVVDKAASKGVIHKNKAARIKSRLNKKLNNLGNIIIDTASSASTADNTAEVEANV